MGRLIRLDRSGHTTLAKWRTGDGSGEERRRRPFGPSSSAAWSHR